MFVKHSFEVKYQARYLRRTKQIRPVSHPRSTLEIMTAALTAPTMASVPPLRFAPVTPETYRRRRLAVLAVVAGMVLGLASFGRQADATPTAEARAADAIIVIVQPGDTLWAIAESLDPGADPRSLVDALSDLAGSSSLQPGQQLVIPGRLLD